MNHATKSYTRRLAAAALSGVALATGCGQGPGEPLAESLERRRDRTEVKAPLAKDYCEIDVKGKGVKKTEDDYLPHVLACENFAGGPEALKAQAIAARSALYWTIADQGSICDSDACQVYTCENKPEPRHYQAVKDTAGMYLSHGGLLTYGGYVAGSKPDPDTCKGAPGGRVTYNSGKTGVDVAKDPRLFKGPPGYGQNRGCMSQLGANCLDKKGKGHVDILKFYYGDDIEILTAPGACVQPPATAACAADAECSNNTTGQGVLCHNGACVDGCRKDAGCPQGGVCSINDGQNVGACSNAPPRLGTECDSDDDCKGAPGRICSEGARRCTLGCRADADCDPGAVCDKSSPDRWRCVVRKTLGEPCADDVECHGGLDGTQRVCQSGVCSDACQGDHDCSPDELCDATTGHCKLRPPKSEPPQVSDGGCVLDYPSVSLNGVPTPEEIAKEYGARGCADQVPPCMLDADNLIDAKTGDKYKFDTLKLSEHFKLREFALQARSRSPYLYVDPALVLSLERTRLAYGAITVKAGYRSAGMQAEACAALCGKETCDGTPCTRCSPLMQGKGVQLKHSSPECTLAERACSAGKFRLISGVRENDEDRLHVDLGEQPECTFQSLPGCLAPPEGAPPLGPPPDPAGSAPGSTPAASSPCLDQLKALGVPFTRTEAFNVTDAVLLTGPVNGVTIADELSTTTTKRFYACEMVRQLHTFLGALHAKGVVRIGTLLAYCVRCKYGPKCITDGKLPTGCPKGLSSHSYGRAIDIRYVVTSDGTTHDINDNATWTRYGDYGKTDTCGTGLAAQSGASLFLYKLACDNTGIFKNFLTPNYNAEHRDHWHADLDPPGSTLGYTFLHSHSPGSSIDNHDSDHDD